MRQIIFALILTGAPLLAAIHHTIDTTTPLSCTLSSQHHNRILVEGSRIKKLIFPEDKLHIRMEETSGQVFVQAKSVFQEKIVVSVVTQEGQVQDLELSFLEIAPQVIILTEASSGEASFTEASSKENNPEEKPMLNTIHHPCYQDFCGRDTIQQTVGAILRGTAPEGYIAAPIIHSTCSLKPGLTTKLVGRLQNWHQNLYIYQIQNNRPWRKRLNESSFSNTKSNWVYLEKNCLKPREKILAIVAYNYELKSDELKSDGLRFYESGFHESGFHE